MTVSQLSLYNGALRLLGERKLGSLAEAREPQRILTDIWTDGNGAIQAMLEKGFWKFATRSAQLNYSPSITPPFGYKFAFNKSTDWVRTMAVCSDPYFNQPLTMYDDEAGFLYSDYTTIYVKFVSNDPSYGLNWSIWTQAFIEYFESYLAWRSAFRITLSKEKELKVEKTMDKLGIRARSLDALDGPTKFSPSGSWTGARRGSTSRRFRSDPAGSW